ncbi:Metallo-dependent phosphatase-like protein [Xylariales sp. AK1849]|nr:Metallo-dependent phosphatase-like protein [Xylariales sp. AK1849]
MAIKTRFFIVSDTHGEVFDVKEEQRADVVIHCGDLTEESKIDEFRTTINLLRQLPAPLKLVISGNHDLTLDEPTFKQRILEATQPIEPDLVEKDFGGFGEARRLFDEAKDAGIVFLDEGNYEFPLKNGALLRVYASPFTPSEGGGAF